MRCLDIAKGISIICIVLGHLGIPAIGHVVFTFHVPIFFLITGYLINDRLSIGEFVKNRAKRLLLPYLVAGMAIASIWTLRNAARGGWEQGWQAAKNGLYAVLYGSGGNYSEPFFIQGIGAVWFLWASFWASCILRVLIGAGPGKRLLAVVLVFMAGQCTRRLFWFPLSIQAGCCAVLFMYAGWLARQAQGAIGKLPREAKMAGLAFALWMTASFIRNFQTFYLVSSDIGRGAIDVAGSLCACGMVIFISWIIDKRGRGLANALSFIGRHSLAVLCAHAVELESFPWRFVIEAVAGRELSESLYLAALIACKAIFIGCVTITASWLEGRYGRNKKRGRKEINWHV